MVQPARADKMTIRLSEEEARLRDALAIHLGIGPSDVLRMGLRKLARAEAIELPTPAAPPPPPAAKPRRR